MRLLLLVLALALDAAPLAAQTLVVRPEICAALTAHVPDPGVAYQPGLDARGGQVAPADLAGFGGPSFDEVALQLTVDLRKRLGIKLDETLFPGGAEEPATSPFEAAGPITTAPPRRRLGGGAGVALPRQGPALGRPFEALTGGGSRAALGFGRPPASPAARASA